MSATAAVPYGPTMSRAAAQLLPDVGPAGTVLDPVGQAMRDVHGSLGGHCLLETEDGQVVSHAVGPGAPGLVVQALLERSSRCLHLAVASRRYVALAPGHGIQALQLPGACDASLVPVVAAGQRLGWLWWVGGGTPPGAGALTDAAARVGRAAALVAGSTDDDGARGWLTGTRTSAPGAGAAAALAVVVATSSPQADAPELAALLRIASRHSQACGTRVDVTTVDGTAFLVVTGERGVPADRLVDHVEALLAGAGVPVLAGASAPVPPHQPGTAGRAQAELVHRAARTPGRCLTPGTARPHLLLRFVEEALSRTDGLGPDPLAPLLEYDAERSGDLAVTLLTWLDAHGDVAVAAERLGLHRNTLRYRLNRAHALLGDDLGDATARLEVHLRLRHALPAG